MTIDLPDFLTEPLSYEHVFNAFKLWIEFPEYISTNAILRADILTESHEGVTSRKEDFPLQSISHTIKDDKIAYYVRRKMVARVRPEQNSVVEDVFVVTAEDHNYIEIYHEVVIENCVKYVVGKRKDISDAENVPYYYPRASYYCISFNFKTNVWNCNFNPLQGCSEENLQKTRNSLRIIREKLAKFSSGNKNGYKKRVNHDKLVPKNTFQDLYGGLKQKYKHWLNVWNEPFYVKDCDIKHRGVGTDPSKHVFEDISILTFLICLWKDMYGQSYREMVRFVDLGCGNGFLTYLLGQEGFIGIGLDLASRDIWKRYDLSDNACLVETTINPKNFPCPFLDENLDLFDIWLIGNHADELTGWIPLLSSKLSSFVGNQSLKVKFVIIPCCFHDLTGSKNQFGSKLPKVEKNDFGKYGVYVNWLENLIENVCGINCEKEFLRIPSTKNIALIGREWLSHKPLSASELEDLFLATPFQPRLAKSNKTIYNSNEEENLETLLDMPCCD